VFVLLLYLVAGSCEKAPATGPNPLVLFAASSVADVLRDVADRFEADTKTRVVITQGASGRLCKQLELGAPCDGYVPADPAYLDRLQGRGLIVRATRKRLATNQLVVIQAGSGARPWPDPAKLLDAKLGLIAIASPQHAPAGRYATQALDRAGLWDRLQGRVLFADNVRMAARYVAEDGARVGIVYATDALAFSDKLTVVYRFSESSHTLIVYEGAVSRRSTNQAAAMAFLQFAASGSAETIWRRHGFGRAAREDVPPKGR